MDKDVFEQTLRKKEATFGRFGSLSGASFLLCSRSSAMCPGSTDPKLESSPMSAPRSGLFQEPDSNEPRVVCENHTNALIKWII